MAAPGPQDISTLISKVSFREWVFVTFISIFLGIFPEKKREIDGSLFESRVASANLKIS